MKTGQRLLVLFGLATLAVGGAIAYASIPGANGTITGCYDKQGDLRLIDAEAGKTCGKKETAITWNQQGPPGQDADQRPFAYAHVVNQRLDPEFTSPGLAMSPGFEHECFFLPFVPRSVSATGDGGAGRALGARIAGPNDPRPCPDAPEASARVDSVGESYYVQFWGE